MASFLVNIVRNLLNYINCDIIRNVDFKTCQLRRTKMEKVQNETMGYKPQNDFTENGGQYWQATKKLLGFRINKFEYTPAGSNFYGCYIADALMNAQGTLGIEIASALSVLVPTDSVETKILCTDIINPYQIPALLGKSSEYEWTTKETDKVVLYQDDSYLIAVSIEKNVHLYLFKKVSPDIGES